MGRELGKFEAAVRGSARQWGAQDAFQSEFGQPRSVVLVKDEWGIITLSPSTFFDLSESA